jgi:hypothetical protein
MSMATAPAMLSSSRHRSPSRESIDSNSQSPDDGAWAHVRRKRGTRCVKLKTQAAASTTLCRTVLELLQKRSKPRRLPSLSIEALSKTVKFIRDFYTATFRVGDVLGGTHGQGGVRHVFSAHRVFSVVGIDDLGGGAG